MFDTQLIIRKAKNGDKDFIAHSLDLFIDFVQVFRKVLILLMQKVRKTSIHFKQITSVYLFLRLKESRRVSSKHIIFEILTGSLFLPIMYYYFNKIAMIFLG